MMHEEICTMRGAPALLVPAVFAVWGRMPGGDMPLDWPHPPLLLGEDPSRESIDVMFWISRKATTTDLGSIHGELFADALPGDFSYLTFKVDQEDWPHLEVFWTALLEELQRRGMVDGIVVAKVKQDALFRQLWLDDKIKTRDIAVQFNMSESSVKNRAKSLGLPRRKQGAKETQLGKKLA